ARKERRDHRFLRYQGTAYSVLQERNDLFKRQDSYQGPLYQGGSKGQAPKLIKAERTENPPLFRGIFFMNFFMNSFKLSRFNQKSTSKFYFKIREKERKAIFAACQQ